MFNSAAGAFAAYKVGPFQDAAAKHYVLFRKTWMKLPIRLSAFGCAYYAFNQVHTRLLPRLHPLYWRHGGQKEASYLANHELISKFRFFDGDYANADAKDDMENYLDLYTSGPLTKADMLQRISDGRSVDERFAKNFEIKRRGRDTNDIFWQYGKIHGLENIAYLDKEQIVKAGNPWNL